MLEKYITVALEKASEDDGKFEEEDAGFHKGKMSCAVIFLVSPNLAFSQCCPSPCTALGTA